uniref:Keratin n=1 Tax=Podarcis muralis TaxID=64176 RepID=A0A670JZ13_PODMU
SRLRDLLPCGRVSSKSACVDPCYAQCPPSTVTIRPPPFVLTIPGPALCCPDQPFCIEQHNPCARYPLGRPSLYGSGGSNVSDFYSQPQLPCNYGSCQF